MIHAKFRIGKNYYGWFVAIPSWYGSFSVLEGFPSFESAIEFFNRHRRDLL